MVTWCDAPFQDLRRSFSFTSFIHQKTQYLILEELSRVVPIGTLSPNAVTVEVSLESNIMQDLPSRAVRHEREARSRLPFPCC